MEHQYSTLLIIIFTTVQPVDGTVKRNEPLSKCMVNRAFQNIHCPILYPLLYMFNIIVIINTDNFPKQHYSVCLSSGSQVCSLFKI
jgi:hypothetical protein